MSEYKFVLLLVIGMVFLLLHRVIAKIDDTPVQSYDGTGRIERIAENDQGYPWYYVAININGSVYTAKTETFRSVPENVDVGDIVHVKYHYTKNGNVRCVITDNGYERLARDAAQGKPVLLYAAGLFFGMFLVMLIRKILLG